MNLINNRQNNTWKRIKTQHIALAAAGALAFSALVGGLAIQEQSSAPSSLSQQTARPAASSDVASSRSEVLVYVVDSEAQASALQASFVNADRESETNVLREVIVVNSPESEAGLQAVQGELLSAGLAGLTVIDLRR